MKKSDKKPAAKKTEPKAKKIANRASTKKATDAPPPLLPRDTRKFQTNGPTLWSDDLRKIGDAMVGPGSSEGAALRLAVNAGISQLLRQIEKGASA